MNKLFFGDKNPGLQFARYVAQLVALAILLCLSACSAPVVSTQTNLIVYPFPESGIISQDTVVSGEIKIEQDILVLAGATLKILPGSRLLFVPTINSRIDPRFLFTSHELTIQGRLIAEGTAEAPIVFSSAADAPKMKDWAGIILDNTSGGESLIQHCKIEYAQTGVYCLGSSPDITKNEFKNNETAIICQQGSYAQIKQNFISTGRIGIACWNESVPLIKENEITKQEKAGVLWANKSLPWLENNTIYNNQYGLYGDEPLEWVNNQIEENTQDFYINSQGD